MAKIMVLGSGSFGIALATLANSNGHEVTLWSYSAKEVELLKKERENKRLLPGILIGESIAITHDLQEVKQQDLLLLSVPSHATGSVVAQISAFVQAGTVIANVGKGMDPNTLQVFSQSIQEKLPYCPVVALSGPSHAEEVARKKATSMVASSRELASAEKVQEWLSNDVMRVYTNDDTLGVQLGGALKNVIAVAIGIIDGLELGDNAKAGVMTRGMTEIIRLGVALGAKGETFIGLSGMGDLIVTCTSIHSRNLRAGILIGTGKTPQEAEAEVGTVEGFAATKAAYALAKEKGVEMPITNELYGILFQGKSVEEVSNRLMRRRRKNEGEFDWIQ